MHFADVGLEEFYLSQLWEGANTKMQKAMQDIHDGGDFLNFSWQFLSEFFSAQLWQGRFPKQHTWVLLLLDINGWIPCNAFTGYTCMDNKVVPFLVHRLFFWGAELQKHCFPWDRNKAHIWSFLPSKQAIPLLYLERMPESQLVKAEFQWSQRGTWGHRRNRPHRNPTAQIKERFLSVTT